MLRKSGIKWASIVLTLAIAGLQSRTLAAQSGPSLEDTLKWLKDSLPSLTGGTFQVSGMTISRMTSLEAIGGCQVRLHHTDTGFGPNVMLSTEKFSFSEIDSSTVKVGQDPSKTQPETYGVGMTTRGGAMTIIENPPQVGKNRVNSTGAGGFTDRSSAERVANAFRHAAELCGKAQPF